MKITKLSILAAMMLVTGISAVSAQTAEEIIKKHESAIGGKKSWEELKTLKKTGNLSVQGMEIPITEYLEVNKALRMEFSVMGMSGYQIITNTGGWMLQPGQTKIDTLKPEMLKMAQKQLDEKAAQFPDYKENGNSAVYTGKDSVENMLCYKIKFTDKDGNVSTSYFDVNTYYLLRTESTVKQDDQEMEVAVTYKDYQKLPEGVVMPMAVSAPMGNIVFKSIEVNKPINDKVFVPSIPAAPAK
jgi:hypothetical protein